MEPISDEVAHRIGALIRVVSFGPQIASKRPDGRAAFKRHHTIK